MSRAQRQLFSCCFFTGCRPSRGNSLGYRGFRHISLPWLRCSRFSELGYCYCAGEGENDELLSIDYSHLGNLTSFGHFDSRAVGGPKRFGGGAFSSTGSDELGRPPA
jgi:hypothetical protein